MSAHFKYTLFILLLAFLTFLLGLYLAGTGAFSPFGITVITEKINGVTQTVVKKGSYEIGYNEALDFARQKLSERGEFEPPRSLTATVKSASGQNVVVEFRADILDPFAEGMATRTIVVGDETQLYERVGKDEEQFKKEYEEFEKAREEFEAAYAANPDAEGLQEPQEPQEYEVKTLAVSDLQPGDRVRVRAKAMEVEASEEGEEAPMVSPFASDTVEAMEIRLYSRPEPEPEEELPGELIEGMNEAAPEEIAEPEGDLAP